MTNLERGTGRRGYKAPVARILVADDNRQLVEMLRATLEEAGYEVASAYSGLAATALLEREPVDLVVLDVLMPGLSGDAVADQLARTRPDLPVLLMTGEAGGQFVRHDRAPQVLRKPFAPSVLVEAVVERIGPAR